MCFYINDNHPNEMIAEKDIVCYKQVLCDYSSEYVDFNYKEYKEYNAKDYLGQDLTNFQINYRSISLGIHSYASLLRSCDFLECLLFKTKIIKCVIPKGTKYYYNDEDNEYVSIKIKRIKFWKLFNNLK